MTAAKSAAQKAVELLKERHLCVAPAESCTGGMLCELLTGVSGASAVLEMGIVSYSCRIKQKLLGVDEATLRQYGAVSEQTAAQMATGIRNAADADFGLSVTGVAGPLESEGKPVGTVFIAVASQDGVTVERLSLSGERDRIRTDACTAVLNLLCKKIERE